MPPKAVYLAMEQDPTLEFDHFLAEQLGGMTVDEMLQRLSNEEYTRWCVYYGRKAQREQIAAHKGR